MIHVLLPTLLALSHCPMPSHQRPGWLDRVVAYRKREFLNDVHKVLPPIDVGNAEDFKATLEEAPPGYKDSPSWDFDSALRLVVLLQRSRHTPKPLRRMINHIAGSRRMALWQTYVKIPSLAYKHPNYFYYDVDSNEMYPASGEDVPIIPDPLKNSTVIYVSNPVEAKLPSMRITVGLLRQILEQRALAARGETPKTLKPRTKPPPGSPKKQGSTTATAAAGDKKPDAGDKKPDDKTDAGKGDATPAAGDDAKADDKVDGEDKKDDTDKDKKDDAERKF